MINEPSTEDIYALMALGSAVPLERIRQYPNGHVFDDARVCVGARDSTCADRLDLANELMVRELAGDRISDMPRMGAIPVSLTRLG